MFEVETKSFVEGSLDNSALNFVSLKTAFENCCLCLATTNYCTANNEGIWWSCPHKDFISLEYPLLNIFSVSGHVESESVSNED